MKDFAFSLYDAPKSVKDGTAFLRENFVKATPMAAAMTGSGRVADLCRMYGYVFLLGQNLEVELRECALNIEFALAWKGMKPRWQGSPAKAKFSGLIRMFEAQLDLSHPGSREISERLGRARRLRNWLAHKFFSSEGFEYVLTEGGQERLWGWLKKLETVFFPLTMIVGAVSQAYAAEYGFTHEFRERLAEEEKRRQEQVENDLRDIFGDVPPDSESKNAGC